MTTEIYRLSDYDADAAPSVLVAYPDVATVSDADGNDLTNALLADGTLVLAGVPNAGAFSVVSDFTASTATFWAPSPGSYVVSYSTDGVERTVAATVEGYGETSVVVDSTARYWFVVPVDGSSGEIRATSTVSNPHIWLVYDRALDADYDARPAFLTAVLEQFPTSRYYASGETPILRARLTESSTGAPIVPSDIKSAFYTCYAVCSYGSKRSRVAVDGFVGVAVPIGEDDATSAFKSRIIADDPRWRVDSDGYNFAFEPDATENDLFPGPGTYEIDVTIVPKAGNPVTLTWTATVK